MITIGMRFAEELEGEFSLCRQIMDRIPAHLLDWQPHPKSPSMGELSVHIADMIDWIKLAATTDQLDYAVKPHQHYTPPSPSALLAYFDQRADGTIESVRHVSDEEMHKPWTVRNGARIFFSRPRFEVIRIDCLNHIIHHRGQLTVYCRLKDVALPGVYGPNGDE